MGVVDQTLPADRGPGLLEVDAHDDEERVLDRPGERGEPLRVLDGRCGIVDRARTHYGEEPAVATVEDVADGLPRSQDDGVVGVAGRELLPQGLGRGERLDSGDPDVLGLQHPTQSMIHAVRVPPAGAGTGSRRSCYGRPGGGDPAPAGTPPRAPTRPG